MMRQLIYILLFNAKHYLYDKGHIRTRPELMYREPDIARRGDWVQLAFPGPEGSGVRPSLTAEQGGTYKYGKRLITE